MLISFYLLKLVVLTLLQEDLKIPLADLVVGENIGHGGFSEVFKGTLQGKNVAIKKVRHKYCYLCAVNSCIIDGSLCDNRHA
jgi:hypothetical protein